jgi:hypothetical protein
MVADVDDPLETPERPVADAGTAEAAADGSRASIESLARSISQVFPGAVVVDRGLELGDGKGAIELTLVDGEGRLLCASRARGASAEVALLALDALAFARENLPLLARHYRGAGLDPELPPLVVLLAERFEPSVLARLAGLDPAGVCCLELRRLSSRERSESYLVPVALAAGAGATHRRAEERAADFLEYLVPDLRPIGERLLERLARLDEDLVPQGTGRQMRFSLDGEPLCALLAQDDALEGRVAPHGAAFRIATRAEADSFLEAVVERTLELFEPAERKGPTLASAAHREGEGGADFDPLLPSGGILTPEELEAFRTPG